VKFDIFCEIQRSDISTPNEERLLIADTIEEARAADRNGFDVWWQVEHHGAPQFSYSSAPEVVLTAIAMNTRRMHVGHAGVLAPFRINGPLRVAERGAMLDVFSNGRFELGLAKTGGKEWETFGCNPETARDELREALQMIPKMWTQPTFSWNSKLFQMPEREVIPRPLQNPHPRLWQTASSPESFRMAGELGVGVLGTTLLSPIEFMKSLLDEYDAGIASCKEPVGQVINNQKGVFTFVHVAESRRQAIESGAAWSALWYVHFAAVAFAVPRSVWYDQIRAGINPHLARKAAYNSVALAGEDPTSLEITPDELPAIVLLKRLARGETVSNEEAHEITEGLDSVIIGDPDLCKRKMQKYGDIGVDRLMCLMQFGRIPHQEVLRSIKLTGEHLIPQFAAANPSNRSAVQATRPPVRVAF
jgi:alkanesulfonate monooxygenase SsuD/methylene tetrahydromethanopterin reductase-like flavin-dependent oxidoreductase (luciferase family)